MTGARVSEWQGEVKLALARYHGAVAPTARVTADVFDVAGHPSQPIAQFAYEYREEFTA